MGFDDFIYVVKVTEDGEDFTLHRNQARIRGQRRRAASIDRTIYGGQRHSVVNLDAVTDVADFRLGAKFTVSANYNVAVLRLKLDCTALAVELL